MSDYTFAAFIFFCAASIFSAAAFSAGTDSGIEVSIVDMRTVPLFIACAVAAAAAASHGVMNALPVVIALAAIAVCAASDIQSGYVFDRVTVTGTVVIVVAAAANGGALFAGLGALFAGGAIVALWALTHGRGIGLGDAKLAALAGAALGPETALCALGAAFVMGAAAVMPALLKRRIERTSTLRFGPYIAAGVVACVLFRGVIR
ncbi:MAG: prepilin peptidase [Candidatus Baltobacteraceae bacterium]